MLRSFATSLSSTAWRYSSQNAMTFRFELVSSTSVFGMYDFEQAASAKPSVRTSAPNVFIVSLSFGNTTTRGFSAAFRELEPKEGDLGKSSPGKVCRNGNRSLVREGEKRAMGVHTRQWAFGYARFVRIVIKAHGPAVHARGCPVPRRTWGG